MPGWIKFVPPLAAGIIVAGNIFSNLSIWGFDYHVLHLPYGSTLQLWSNLIVIALAIFPLVSTKEGWHHYAYIVLAIFALALLSRNLSFNIYALLFLGSEGVRDETGSIFFARTSQRITYTILIVYLLWSLSLASVVRREIGLIFIALAMSAVVSGNYMVDTAKRHQEAGGGILLRKTWHLRRVHQTCRLTRSLLSQSKTDLIIAISQSRR